MKVKLKINVMERYFAVIIVAMAILALIKPELFMWFKPWIVVGLGLVIFSIGLHLPVATVIQPLTQPGKVLALVVLRYGFMPGIAYSLAYGLQLSTTETIGLVVLGTAPGGVAANVMAYLGKANVSLTILLTLGSTLLSPVITPALIYVFLHHVVHIDWTTMAIHIGLIILGPISAGLLCAHFSIPGIEAIKKGLPYGGMAMIVMIVGCVVAWNQTAILKFPITLFGAVLILNILGYALGAVIARCLKWDFPSILATVFDYGMFDGAVAIMICTLYFSSDSALAAVCMGVIQNITALILIRCLGQLKK